MRHVRISGWVAAAGLVLAGCGESRIAAENEACMGPADDATVDYVALGMPSAEPDLQAWVIAEQHGMMRVTTRPCEPNPPARTMVTLSDAPVVLRDGTRGTFANVRPGQRLSIWYGGAKGKAGAVTVDRVASWPPTSATTAEEAAAAEPEAGATPDAVTLDPASPDGAAPVATPGPGG